MSDAPLAYAVLLTKPEDLKFQPIAKALAAFNGVPVPDTAVAAKGSWGIVADKLDEARAKDLVARLAAEGLGALAVPQNLLEDLPELRLAAKAELDEAGLRVLAPGEPVLMRWDSVQLLAAVGLQKAVASMVTVKEGPTQVDKAINMGIMMATGLPIKIGGKEQTVQKRVETQELFFYLDLVTVQPSARVRIDAQAFNYACLGERMTYSVITNFKALLTDISRRVPSALLNKGADVLLKGAPVNTMGYGSLTEFEREMRWRLTLLALRR